MSRTADWYSRFAEVEAPGQSPIYAGWAEGVAADDAVLALLRQLPLPKRQPNLIFACARLLGSPEGGYPEWRRWLLANWAEVKDEAAARSTQTNEPRRCALLLPVLASLAAPIALLEVGASAGLCLYPDRYSYSYDGRRVDPAEGPSSVLLECATTGNPPIPDRMPEIAWRAGIDLNPLDVSDPGDAHWLETLIWPEQQERRERVRVAMDVVRMDPPRIVRGNATESLPALAAEAPADSVLVVVTSASIVYFTPENRARFIETVSASDARWISNEGVGVVPAVRDALAGRLPPRPDLFALALDGIPLAWTGPHGQTLDWIAQ